MSVAHGRAVWGVLALLWGCTTGLRDNERSADVPATAWHYEVAVDPALTRLETKLCFEGAVPRELRAGKDEAAHRLLWARWLGPGAVRKLRVEHGRIQLLDDRASGCLAYAVSLTEGGSLDAAVRRVGNDLIASPNVWLWRPERRATSARATLALKLPPKLSSLLPWPEQGGVRVLDAQAFRFDSYAAFGSFTRVIGRAGDVEIEAALLDGELGVDSEAVLRWLVASVHVASLSDGVFPRRRLSAVIVPSGDRVEPVPFGMVARGGAASVLLLLGRQATERELLHDWVLPHELGHLLLPFVDREHPWVSEGFATYYQELLLARAGVYSEAEALAHMRDSLRSAEAQDPGGSVMPHAGGRVTNSYHKVYWGGAAFWLRADVELRRRTQGRASLDTVLHTLRVDDAEGGVWTLHALVARLDALAGAPVFAELLAEAEKHAFLPYDATLHELGVHASEGELALSESAPLAALRRGLFAPPDRVR